MVHRLIVVALAIMCFLSIAAAQEQKNGYRVTDPNGKGVYLIPEIIAGKTVKATMSQPGNVEAPAPVKGAVFAVQVGAFAVPSNAVRLTADLERKHFRVTVSKAFFHRRNLSVDVVTIRGLASMEEAQRVLGMMRASYQLEGLIVPPDASTLASE